MLQLYNAYQKVRSIWDFFKGFVLFFKSSLQSKDYSVPNHLTYDSQFFFEKAAELARLECFSYLLRKLHSISIMQPTSRTGTKIFHYIFVHHLVILEHSVPLRVTKTNAVRLSKTPNAPF